MKKFVAFTLTLLMVLALVGVYGNASAGANESILPYTGDTITYKATVADVGITEDKNSPVYQVFSEMVGNVEFDWEVLPWSDFDTKVSLYLNSGDVPDVIWAGGSTIMNTWAYSGLLLDLNKYTDYMPNLNRLSVTNPSMKQYTNDNGELLCMPGLDNDFFEQAWMANKTLLDQYNIAVPTNLSEFEAACDALLEADPSVSPFLTIWGFSYYKSIFGASLDARQGIYFDLETKTWKHALLNPESNYKELISLLADYYGKGYFNAEFMTMSEEQTKALMASTKWGLSYFYGSDVSKLLKVDGQDSLSIEVVPMLPLAADGVKANTSPGNVSDNPYWSYCISANVYMPELVCAVLDTVYSEELSSAYQWGVEGVSYTIDSNGEKQWIQEFLDKGNDAMSELGIWNTMLPRYVTKRDDNSLLRRAEPLQQELTANLTKAIVEGKVDVSYYRLTPDFTEQENEELSIIMTPVNTIIDEAEMSFVLGKRPMSEWDDFVKQVTSAGDLSRAEEIYNNAKQKPDRLQSKDRDYLIP